MIRQELVERLKQAGLEAEAQAAAAELQAVLTGEIHHRMRNMIAMVTAVVRQSIRASTDLPEAERAITIRLQAMSKAHDMLLDESRMATSLLTIIRGAIGQHDRGAGSFEIDTVDFEVQPSVVVPLTLALNELCTNAIKYGALSSPSGRIRISWSLGPDTIRLLWIEQGGPLVEPLSRNGFGTRLIEQALPRQLGGSGHITFAPRGVEFELIVPLARFLMRPTEPEELVTHE